MPDHLFKTIAVVHSPFRQKFGIPRQPGLCPSVTGQIELRPPYNHPDTIRGLEGFSHIWIIFVFHAIEKEKWNPLVRPPRLGGNERVGVFASRSTHRPNPIGQSVVKLEKIENKNQKLILHISGHDLLNGTPVLDIKPYLPYAENIPQASSGFLKRTDFIPLQVSFTETAKAECQQWENKNQQALCDMLIEILQQDPRPAYHKKITTDREYGMQIYDLNIRYRLVADMVEIFELMPAGET
ncbi:MAG TPA: tRNA (N6-threonylcarbamoyladenosine(37)-N6)-methyltransferase TrmO [Chromatiales bacterium]|nr:tRNA (N6-threonylcarbamoyladenosine(37)-N6)-methyltransferase TrmO [Thiotrichales bacterium]HIP69297.1 tRNA (N6-threonylcarbamoyladenosine(37)-N6)-methyltransferase TrmO [Chromatiales bacterium]